MWKNIARVASLLSAITIGAVLVARASGCTNEDTPTPEAPAVAAPAAPVAQPTQPQPPSNNDLNAPPKESGIAPPTNNTGPLDSAANIKRNNVEPMPVDFMPASKAGPPLRKREEFLPATKAAMPIFEPDDVQPQQQAAQPPVPSPPPKQKAPNPPQQKQ